MSKAAAKSEKISESLATARLLAFQIAGRRLPAPQWKENGGEVRFASDRPDIPRERAKKTDRAPQWAFDFAWPDYKLALEVEGIVVMRDRHTGRAVSTGGHTDPQGFEDDCEKYAWAAVLGWRLVRFTPKQVKSGFAIDMLVRLFAVVDEPVRIEVPRVVFDPGTEPPQWTPEEIARMQAEGRVPLTLNRLPGTNYTNELAFEKKPDER